MERDYMEFRPNDVRLWHANFKPLPFGDCDRIRIYPEVIEFRRGRDYFEADFCDNPILADSSLSSALIQDRLVRDLSVFNWPVAEENPSDRKLFPLN